MNDKTRFGELKEAYNSGRRGYPEDSINYISSLMPNNGRVLDLGCGTGIAIRQLFDKGFDIVGCDSDARMIEVAKRYKSSGIKYFTSPADNLLFPNEEFDAITSFGAFHWFKDQKSISEIKRVLKTNGVFVVINKNDSGRFRRDYREIISNVVGKLPPSIKRGYNPKNILKRSGFWNVEEKIFETTERFTIGEALTLIKSTGSWNYVPPDLVEKVEHNLTEKLRRMIREGLIYRPVNVAVVSGRKS